MSNDTYIGALDVLLKQVAGMKTLADANLPFLLQLETTVLEERRSPQMMMQAAGLTPPGGPNASGAMPGGPGGPGGMPGMPPGGGGVPGPGPMPPGMGPGPMPGMGPLPGMGAPPPQMGGGQPMPNPGDLAALGL
jgi:hypothetical protein